MASCMRVKHQIFNAILDISPSPSLRLCVCVGARAGAVHLVLWDRIFRWPGLTVQRPPRDLSPPPSSRTIDVCCHTQTVSVASEASTPSFQGKHFTVCPSPISWCLIVLFLGLFTGSNPMVLPVLGNTTLIPVTPLHPNSCSWERPEQGTPGAPRNCAWRQRTRAMHTEEH